MIVCISRLSKTFLLYRFLHVGIHELWVSHVGTLGKTVKIKSGKNSKDIQSSNSISGIDSFRLQNGTDVLICKGLESFLACF